MERPPTSPRAVRARIDRVLAKRDDHWKLEAATPRERSSMNLRPGDLLLVNGNTVVDTGDIAHFAEKFGVLKPGEKIAAD